MKPVSIAAFGLELKPLEEADLPLLCHWRNNPEILPYMDDPRPIQPRALSVWLNKVRGADFARPYIVYQSHSAVAYTEIKHIDWENSSCEGGLFVFGKDHLGTGLAYKIILCREIIMHELNLKTLISRVQCKNARGANFCVKYGGEYVRQDGDFLIYRHEISKRREQLKAIAAIMGLAEEFSLRFAGEQP